MNGKFIYWLKLFVLLVAAAGCSRSTQPEFRDRVNAEIPEPGEFRTLSPDSTPGTDTIGGSPDGMLVGNGTGQTPSSAGQSPSTAPAPPDTGMAASGAGLTRSHPAQLQEWVSAPNWDLQVLQVARGERAWDLLKQANRLNEPPPAGYEYLLVRLRVKSTYNGDTERMISSCDFDITGSRRVRYPCALVVEPNPPLKARLFLHGETQGWAAFLVQVDEDNLILVFDEILNFNPDRHRFIALEPGASVTVSPELVEIEPNDIGMERGMPAQRGEVVVTRDWELSVLEVLDGEEALNVIQSANQFNAPPPGGRRYLAVRLSVRYIGISDSSVNISSSSFKCTGGMNILYEPPLVVAPEPRLDFELYPGGQVEGWLVVQAAQTETGLVLVIQHILDVEGEARRYLALD